MRLTEIVYPSDANFLLVKVKNANYIYNTLIDKSIIVRNRAVLSETASGSLLVNRSENNKLINALKSIINMKKVLFIDRDGTIIAEPADEQVDSFEKMVFLPGAISCLSLIAKETDFELVMVTNQDGLGYRSFPEETFWPVQNKMLEILKGEGVVFREIFIDRTCLPKCSYPETRHRNAGKIPGQGIDLDPHSL